jgi:predicted ABC-type ATPase
MIVVAGPPGSGKSSVFPVAQTGVDHFNIDDRAAQLNGGSYRNIPPEIRAQSNRECELFIEAHIRGQKSFAVETTLRTRKTLEQARLARENAFRLEMIFVALDRVEDNIERIAMRADAGGHAASPGRIRVWVYDNTPLGNPRLVLETEGAKIRTVAEHPPSWLRKALKPTEFDFESQSPPLQSE